MGVRQGDPTERVRGAVQDRFPIPVPVAVGLTGSDEFGGDALDDAVEQGVNQAVRLLLEAGDAGALNGVARELLELGTPEERTAGRTILEIANRSSGELMAIAGYALRAL